MSEALGEALTPTWWRILVSGREDDSLVLSSFRFGEACLETENDIEAQVLRVLRDTTSYMLQSDNWSNPFTPLAVMGGRRSALPEDLSESERALLRRIAGTMDDSDCPSLRARICDVYWTCIDRSDKGMLIQAIESYSQVSLEPSVWHGDGDAEWHRGLELAIRRRASGLSQLERMTQLLLERLDRVNPTDGFFGVQLSATLRRFNLVEEGGRAGLAMLAVQQAELARNEDSRKIEQDWHEEASLWFAKARLWQESVSAQVGLARALSAEAEDRRQGVGGDPATAAHFVEQALKVLEVIPRIYRANHDVDEMIVALRLRLVGDRQAVLDSMIPIEGGPVELSEMTADARTRVTGLPPVEALCALGSIQGDYSASNALERCEAAVRDHPLMAIFGGETLASSGRRVAVRQGGIGNIGGKDDGRMSPAVWHAMLREYGLYIGLVVRGRILPAVEVLTMESRFTIDLLYELCHRSPWIPAGHEYAWAKGLLHGLNQDFVSASCILVPQVENLVRLHIQRAGAHTIVTEQDGTENEKGLPSLLDDEKTEEVFGSDLVFEMRALFTDSAGPNLRNTIAHGLASDHDLLGDPSTYSWWLALRFAMRNLASAPSPSGPVNNHLDVDDDAGEDGGAADG